MTERPDDALFRRPAPEQRRSSAPDGLSRRDRRERERAEAARREAGAAAAAERRGTVPDGAAALETGRDGTARTGAGRGPGGRTVGPVAPQTPDIGVSAYLEARTAVEDARVRAAFDELRARVVREATPPPASVILARSRHPVRTSRVRVPLVAAASVVLVAGLAVAFVRMPDGGAATAVPATTPSALPITPPPPEQTEPSRLPSVVVVTVTATPQAPRTTKTRTRTAPAVAKPTTRTTTPKPAAPPLPTTEVTVYLWQSALYPSCGSQYAVKRTITGDGSWGNVMRSLLSGTTASERAAGYVSPFGPGTQYTLDEQTYTVDFTSKAVIDSALTACRDSLDQLIKRTAVEAGHSADVTMNGTSLRWLQWRIGQA